MNRQETLQLLAVLSAYYNIKVQDPSATATTWERVLAGYSAEAITKAAQLHMNTSKWSKLPTPAELIKLIPKAELIARSEQAALEPPKRAKVTAIPDGMTEDEFIDSLWNATVEWEKEVWPDGDDDSTAGFLPYET